MTISRRSSRATSRTSSTFVAPTCCQRCSCHLAAGSGSLISMRAIAQALTADEKTVRAYVRLLELLHLLVSVPAWSPGFAARAVRAPRVFVEDSGLMSHLLNANATRIAQDDALSGRAYESFVAMESRACSHTPMSHPQCATGAARTERRSISCSKTAREGWWP